MNVNFFLTLYFTSFFYFLYFGAPAHFVLREEFPEIWKDPTVFIVSGHKGPRTIITLLGPLVPDVVQRSFETSGFPQPTTHVK